MFFNKKIKIDTKSIEHHFQRQILARIPTLSDRNSIFVPFSAETKNRDIITENEQSKIQDIFLDLFIKVKSQMDNESKSVVITSCEDKAGKTTTAINLALAAAANDQKVLLLDCNIENPSISTSLGLPRYSEGLINFLSHKINTLKIYKPLKLSDDPKLLYNLDVIPTGGFTNISADLLNSNKMDKIINNNNYDFIVIDSSSLNSKANTYSMIDMAKNAIIVVNLNQTSKSDLYSAISEMNTPHALLTGLLVNFNRS